VADEQGKATKPSKIAELRAQYPWLDHLARAGESYTENHGNHYAAAITYFSVLALFPLLMVAFAVVAFMLRANQALIDQLKESITKQVPGMGATLGQVIDSALHSAGTVGTIGLLVALYSGLGWMSNLREALSAQWNQPTDKLTFLRKNLFDLLALIGLGLALALSAAVAAIGGLAKQIPEWLGLGDQIWLSPVIRLAVILLGLLSSALVFLWVIARLPREAVTWRSAAKAALIGAVGMEVIKQVMVIYIVKVTNSPTGALFGPILGLMVFIFTVSRFILFLTAWAATARENQIAEPPPVPGPAMIHSEVTVRSGPGVGAAAGLVGAGVVAGVIGGLFGRRR
jgi:membrane protein